MSTEVSDAYDAFNAVGENLSVKDIELLTKIHTKKYMCETSVRRVVSLKSLETGFVKAKHAVTETEEEDFV